MDGYSFLHTQKFIFDIEGRIKAAHVRNGTPKNRYTKSEKLINIPTDSFYRMSYVYLTYFIHKKKQNILYVGKTGMTRGNHKTCVKKMAFFLNICNSRSMQRNQKLFGEWNED